MFQHTKAENWLYMWQTKLIEWIVSLQIIVGCFHYKLARIGYDFQSLQITDKSVCPDTTG